MTPHTLDYWQSKPPRCARKAAPIDGAYADAADGATFEALSPIDGRKLADVAACGQADVDRAVAAARRAFEAGAWSALAPARARPRCCAWPR